MKNLIQSTNKYIFLLIILFIIPSCNSQTKGIGGDDNDNNNIYIGETIEVTSSENKKNDRNLALFELGYNFYLLGFIESSEINTVDNYNKGVNELSVKINEAVKFLEIERSEPKNTPEEYKDLKKQLSKVIDKDFLEIGLNTAILETIILAFPELPNELHTKGYNSFLRIKNELKLLLIQYNLEESLTDLPTIEENGLEYSIKGQFDNFIAKLKGEIRK